MGEECIFLTNSPSCMYPLIVPRESAEVGVKLNHGVYLLTQNLKSFRSIPSTRVPKTHPDVDR